MSESDLDSPLAAPERRLLARLIETLIEVTPGLIGVGLGLVLGSRTLMRIGLAASAVAWLAVVLVSLVWLHRYGQSVGKRILGLRIVRADGSRAGLGRLFALRELLPAVFFMIPLIGFMLYTVDRIVIFGEERRCVHDRIADTIVIDTRAKQEPSTF